MVDKRFAGKVALVTGATRGMGRATAVRLAIGGRAGRRELPGHG